MLLSDEGLLVFPPRAHRRADLAVLTDKILPPNADADSKARYMEETEAMLWVFPSPRIGSS